MHHITSHCIASHYIRRCIHHIAIRCTASHLAWHCVTLRANTHKEPRSMHNVHTYTAIVLQHHITPQHNTAQRNTRYYNTSDRISKHCVALHIYIHTYIHTYMHAYIHYIHTYIHTCIHTLHYITLQ